MATFVIHARRTPELLGRVVLLFHRLALEIVGLTLERTDNERCYRLTIEIDSHSDKCWRIEASLCKIVDVFSVETITSTHSKS